MVFQFSLIVLSEAVSVACWKMSARARNRGYGFHVDRLREASRHSFSSLLERRLVGAPLVACNGGRCLLRAVAAAVPEAPTGTRGTGHGRRGPAQRGTDVIDPDFKDDNCDGTDGVVADCIFVSASLGSGSGLGTRDDPVDTITGGIAAAQAQGKIAVCVSAEVYTEAVTVVSGISVYGGFDHEDAVFPFRRTRWRGQRSDMCCGMD